MPVLDFMVLIIYAGVHFTVFISGMDMIKRDSFHFPLFFMMFCHSVAEIQSNILFLFVSLFFTLKLTNLFISFSISLKLIVVKQTINPSHLSMKSIPGT